MCGLVGVFGRITWDDRKRFESLLRMDIVRGEDSTGMFSVINGQAEVYKSLALPTEFLQIKTVEKLIRDTDTALIGHNRAATQGSVTAAYAHPFQHGHITLIHNGTLRGQTGLTKQYGSYYNAFTESDSEAICASLADVDDPAEVIENLSGAFALIWHDSRDDSINFVRNNERPLHMLEVVNDRAIFLSSEKGILYSALTRGNGGYSIDGDINDYITEVPVGVLHKVTFKPNRDIEEVTKRELSLQKKYGSQSSTRSGKTNNYQTSQQSKTTSSHQQTSGGSKGGSSASDPKTGEVIPFDSDKKPSVAEYNLKQKLDLKPGWYGAYYVGFQAYSGNSRLGELTVCLDGHGYNHVIVHAVEDLPDGSDMFLQVYVTGLAMTAHGNANVENDGNYVLSGKEVKHETEQPAEVSDPKFQCQNCLEHIPEGSGYIESDSLGKMCQGCYYGDSSVRDMLSLEGLNEKNMRFD